MASARSPVNCVKRQQGGACVCVVCAGNNLNSLDKCLIDVISMLSFNIQILPQVFHLYSFLKPS